MGHSTETVERLSSAASTRLMTESDLRPAAARVDDLDMAQLLETLRQVTDSLKLLLELLEVFIRRAQH